MQEYVYSTLGGKVSCFERCPQLDGVLIEKLTVLGIYTA